MAFRPKGKRGESLLKRSKGEMSGPGTHGQLFAFAVSEDAHPTVSAGLNRRASASASPGDYAGCAASLEINDAWRLRNNRGTHADDRGTLAAQQRLDLPPSPEPTQPRSAALSDGGGVPQSYAETSTPALWPSSRPPDPRDESDLRRAPIAAASVLPNRFVKEANAIPESQASHYRPYLETLKHWATILLSLINANDEATAPRHPHSPADRPGNDSPDLRSPDLVSPDLVNPDRVSPDLVSPQYGSPSGVNKQEDCSQRRRAIREVLEIILAAHMKWLAASSTLAGGDSAHDASQNSHLSEFAGGLVGDCGRSRWEKEDDQDAKAILLEIVALQASLSSLVIQRSFDDAERNSTSTFDISRGTRCGVLGNNFVDGEGKGYGRQTSSSDGTTTAASSGLVSARTDNQSTVSWGSCNEQSLGSRSAYSAAPAQASGGAKGDDEGSGNEAGGPALDSNNERPRLSLKERADTRDSVKSCVHFAKELSQSIIISDLDVTTPRAALGRSVSSIPSSSCLKHPYRGKPLYGSEKACEKTCEEACENVEERECCDSTWFTPERRPSLPPSAPGLESGADDPFWLPSPTPGSEPGGRGRGGRGTRSSSFGWTHSDKSIRSFCGSALGSAVSTERCGAAPTSAIAGASGFYFQPQLEPGPDSEPGSESESDSGLFEPLEKTQLNTQLNTHLNSHLGNDFDSQLSSHFESRLESGREATCLFFSQSLTTAATPLEVSSPSSGGSIFQKMRGRSLSLPNDSSLFKWQAKAEAFPSGEAKTEFERRGAKEAPCLLERLSFVERLQSECAIEAAESGVESQAVVDTAEEATAEAASGPASRLLVQQTTHQVRRHLFSESFTGIHRPTHHLQEESKAKIDTVTCKIPPLQEMQWRLHNLCFLLRKQTFPAPFKNVLPTGQQRPPPDSDSGKNEIPVNCKSHKFVSGFFELRRCPVICAEQIYRSDSEHSSPRRRLHRAREVTQKRLVKAVKVKLRFQIDMAGTRAGNDERDREERVGENDPITDDEYPFQISDNEIQEYCKKEGRGSTSAQSSISENLPNNLVTVAVNVSVCGPYTVLYELSLTDGQGQLKAQICESHSFGDSAWTPPNRSLAFATPSLPFANLDEKAIISLKIQQVRLDSPP